MPAKLRNPARKPLKPHVLGLFTLGSAEAIQFLFLVTRARAPHGSPPPRHLTLEEATLLNADTRACPAFRSQVDAELSKKIYRNIPVLIREEESS